MNHPESETTKKNGLLSRFFGKAAQPQPQARVKSTSPSGSAEIAMNAGDEHAGRRLNKAKSVLIIAADDATSRRWKRELHEWGYGVESTHSGVKGLDILYNVAFDGLLLDLKAPGIDGLDVLRRIRVQDELKTLFISAFAPGNDAQSEMGALEAGANRVFSRGSVGVDEILTSLKTALFPRILQAQPRSKQAGGAASRKLAEITQPPQVIASPLEPSGPPALNKKVLIIDADEAVAGIYRAQIEAAGYEVEVALNGETGFHDLYKINPDALLLDLLLPGELSGSEILKKTRAQKKFEKTPILVFTNIYTRDVEEEARNAGALRLFNKAAATPRDVIDALNEIFRPLGAVLGGDRPSIRFDGAELPQLNGAPGGPARVAPLNVNDREFQLEIRESLLQSAPEFVKTMRGLLQVLLRSQGDPASQPVQILELYTRVHSLSANAAIAGFTKVARLSGALEAMLREFHTKPEGLNASTRRTLTQAMDFLAMLFTGAATHEAGPPIQEKILVVDDEIISRRVIGHSLEKAGLKSTAVAHPDEALKLLEDQPFDLIFLDVEMPGMNGFELCKRLRAMPLHAKTPVLFVTGLNGFESRAKSSLSGGDDFIGKPFSYIELAVKALIHVLRGSIEQQPATPAAPAAANPPGGRPTIAMPHL